jgi:hypothetical protein
MLRILIITAAIAAAMFAVNDGRVLAKAGLVGSCTEVAAPLGDEGAWQACRAGRLEGRPDLSRKSCWPQAMVREVEYWRCPAPFAGPYSTD